MGMMGFGMTGMRARRKDELTLSAYIHDSFRTRSVMKKNFFLQHLFSTLALPPFCVFWALYKESLAYTIHL